MRQKISKNFEFNSPDDISSHVKPLSVGLGLGSLKAKTVITSSSQSPSITQNLPQVVNPMTYGYHGQSRATLSKSKKLYSIPGSLKQNLKEKIFQGGVVLLLLIATSISVLVMVTLALKVTPVESIGLIKKAFSAKISIARFSFSYKLVIGILIALFYYLVSNLVIKRKYLK